MDAAAESTRFSLGVENEQADAGWPSPYRETKLSGANEDREMVIFPVQLAVTYID